MSHLCSNCAAVLLLILATGCATVEKAPEIVDTGLAAEQQREAQAESIGAERARLKHKIAIGRFTNETRYGKALLGGSLDPLGRQTADMLAMRLVESNAFIILERPDIGIIELEQQRNGQPITVGADVLVVGSLTEFGRSTTGREGFLSNTKRQRVHARVDVRLIDVTTGHAFHSAMGTGEAFVEAGGVAGFGNRAEYDASLNDRAIGAAVTDLVNSIVTSMEDRAWRSFVIDVSGSQVIIEGGQSQGVQVGDHFAVKRKGRTVESRQTGFNIELPGSEIARVEVVSQFGESETNEGSVCRVISGTLDGYSVEELIVEATNE